MKKEPREWPTASSLRTVSVSPTWNAIAAAVGDRGWPNVASCAAPGGMTISTDRMPRRGETTTDHAAASTTPAANGTSRRHHRSRDTPDPTCGIGIGPQASRLPDRYVGGDGAGSLQPQGELEPIPHLEIPLEVDQHHVQPARLQHDPGSCW